MRLASGLRGDLVPFGPLISVSRAHPYSGYARLRLKNPVYPSLLGVVVVTGYSEAHAMLKEPRLGREPPFADLVRPGSTDADALQAQALADVTVLFSNPPDHTRLRSFMSRAFQPRVLEGKRARFEAMADELIDAAGSELDVIAQLAQPFPVRVIAELIGVPREDWPQCIAWSADLAPTIDAVIEAEQFARAQRAGGQFGSYVRALTQDRRAHPRDDLLTTLVQVRDAGGELSEDELVSNIMTLFIAGHETTTHLIGNAFVLLHQHPDQREKLDANPALLDSAIEEVLRFEAPIQLASRVAQEDVEVLGHRLTRGQGVWVMLGAANRDPSRFPDPDRFDIERDPNPHLAFGSGIHFCLGAALARLEARILLGRFFARYPRWRLSDAPLELQETLTLRGYRRIPLITGRRTARTKKRR